MNEKQLDIYFRVNLRDEIGDFQKAIGNRTQNILHSVIMEIEKDNSHYNRFKEDYKIQFFNYDEETKKMTLIKEFNFTDLGAKNYGQHKQN